MSSSLTKQEIVAFEKLVEGFDDALVIAKGATLMTEGTPQDMDRARDQFWVPAPMIGRSYDGSDATGHFGDATQLNVPVSVGNWKHSAKSFSATQLRNSFALDQYAKSAKQKLASDINMSIFNMVAQQGAVVSQIKAAPTGYSDVADLDSRFARLGVMNGDRMAFYAPSVMNAMAGNLASRSEDSQRSRDAYENALIRHDIAGFAVYKNDQEILLAAAGGGTTTVNGANQKTVPAATTSDAVFGENNKDNRYTDLVITATTYANIKVGDAFTIANVNSVHMITKQSTGQLKTFRVVGKPAANTIRIYPAIINGTSDAEVEYQSVDALPATGAAITWLNTAAASMNPFFKKETVVLIPGSFEVENGSGVISTSATTELGVQITYTKQTNINTLLSSCRYDIRWGVGLLNPELAGCQLFNQV